MTTPKKPTETGSAPGENNAIGELLTLYKLHDKDNRWMDYAKCHMGDGITWFPEQGQRHLIIEAKKFCVDCPAKQRCLDWALNNEIMYGVWGGRSSKEREKTLSARKHKVKMTS